MPDQPPDRDEPISFHGRDPEDLLRAPLKVDPEAPPANRNEDEPVEEPEPLKDQGDPLTDE
ncbi:MAG: hypothetical protein JWO21_2116 [Solirubrobacterales bacterium]|nr:hypothetical protein [Solirubrobacterales bacterium]